jgi:hypothetical protein
MKGDFSRIRFNPAKNYTAVMQQQGRVALDADANEQTAIDAYLRDTTNVDVIGRYGGPADDAGFAITINSNGEILIGPGRYYVDGILVENDRVVHYADQRFLIPPTGSGAEQISEADLIAALAAGDTVQFVLEVWRRFVTELDDPCLIEPAIGQADTTGRLQTIWRVVGTIGDTVGTKPALAAKTDATVSTEIGTKSAALNPAPGDVIVTVGDPKERSKCPNPISQLSSCCQLLYKTAHVEHTGRMAAKTVPTDDCGCQPIPAAGYQGLENQLYRVEIHTGGPFSTATFKWSRENASVVAKVTNVSGSTITVNTLGPDANLGYEVGEWVELSDDTYLYGDPPNQPGVLYQIQSFGPQPLTVTFASSIAGVVDPTKNARMRRWDQPSTSGTSAGIPLSNTFVPLENGIVVSFSQDGNFVSGDYWTIPARTADGQIDWACGETGDPFLPPHYFAIYTAPLACVHQASNTFSNNPPGNIPPTNNPATGAKPPANDTSRIFVPPPSPYTIDDCRLKFPPLTAVTCGDQGPCTIIPRPGPGWEAPLLALKPGANADICFPIGDFPVTNTIVLEGLGSLRLTGGGYGTQILATGVTAALIFSKCNSVQISDLFASTCTVRIRNQRNTTPPLGGLLSFADCAEVSIDSVALKCGYAEERTASCINVQNTYVPQATTKSQSGARLSAFEERGGTPVPVTGSGEVRIRHCNLEVGGNQEGILLVRVGRAQIEDNTLVAWRPKAFTLRQRLQNPRFRASAVSQLISSAQYVKVANQDLKQGEAAAHPAPSTPAPESNAPAPADAQPGEAHNAEAGTSQPTEAPKAAPANPQQAETAKAATDTLVGDLPIKTVKPNATVNIGGQTVQFQTHPLLKDFWQRYFETETNVPKLFATSRDLLLYVKKTALTFLTNPKQYQGNSAMTAVIAGLDQADQVVIGRAISVGGEGIQECRILNNSIHNAVEGITVGMSNHKQNPFTNEIAGTVIISGNQIYVGLPPRSISRAHAIFVGNVNSLMIENNYAEVLANANANSTFSSYFERLSFLIAIQVWGVFGRRIIVRHCHLAGFDIGILLDAVESLPVDQTPLWVVADNMAEDTFRVAVPGGLAQATNVTNMWINNLS